MTGDNDARGTVLLATAAEPDHWLKRCWRYLTADASTDIAAWQATLLGRRKLTRPAEVMKMRQPVRPNTRATWYR